MEKFRKTLDRFERVVIDLCAVLLVAIVFVIVFQVVARRMNISVSGTEELARYCYVLFVFLLWPIAARRGEDLRITVLFDIIPARVRTIVMGVFQIFMAGYSAVCIYSIILNIKNAATNGLVLPSNTWVHMTWIYAILFLALALTFLANLIRAAFLFMGMEHIKTQQEINEEEMAQEAAKIAAELQKEASE